MSGPFKPGTPAAFFYRHAGCSWTPAVETREQGRARGASELADAERIAREAGASFAWSIDPETDSSSFSSARPAWPLWQVIMHAPDGEVLTSLGGVDFGRDGEPWGDPYRRVCEAECALEVLHDVRALLEVAA